MSLFELSSGRFPVVKNVLPFIMIVEVFQAHLVDVYILISSIQKILQSIITSKDILVVVIR